MIPLRPAPRYWPARRTGEPLEDWAGRALRGQDSGWEASLREIERLEAEREAELVAQSRTELAEELRMRR